jgi:hypothetical protein
MPLSIRISDFILAKSLKNVSIYSSSPEYPAAPLSRDFRKAPTCCWVFPIKLPLPLWEGIKGRVKVDLTTPTSPPPSRGRKYTGTLEQDVRRAQVESLPGVIKLNAGEHLAKVMNRIMEIEGMSQNQSAERARLNQRILA